MNNHSLLLNFARTFVPRKLVRPVYRLSRNLLFTKNHFRVRAAELVSNKSAFTEAEQEVLASISLKISSSDRMYQGDIMHYYRNGFSGMRCIEEAIRSAGIKGIQTILDLPCGHGRVLRHICQRFPGAQIIGCDLDEHGVKFCKDELGVTAVISKIDLTTLHLPHQFDLIWCGSLITHFDENQINTLLTFFHRHLSPNGLLVFSAHGEEAARRIKTAGASYSISQPILDALFNQYEQEGYGYQDYAGEPGIGVSLTTPEWMRGMLAKIGLREVYFSAHGWDNHHDIFGVMQSA